MTIEKKLEDGALTLAVAGRLDTNTAPELEAEVASLSGGPQSSVAADAQKRVPPVSEIVFDFAALEYISSAGLRVLMTAHKAMAASGGAMKILHPNDMVRGVFDITGLDSVFTVEE